MDHDCKETANLVMILNQELADLMPPGGLVGVTLVRTSGCVHLCAAIRRNSGLDEKRLDTFKRKLAEACANVIDEFWAEQEVSASGGLPS